MTAAFVTATSGVAHTLDVSHAFMFVAIRIHGERHHITIATSTAPTLGAVHMPALSHAEIIVAIITIRNLWPHCSNVKPNLHHVTPAFVTAAALTVHALAHSPAPILNAIIRPNHGGMPTGEPQ